MGEQGIRNRILNLENLFLKVAAPAAGGSCERRLRSYLIAEGSTANSQMGQLPTADHGICRMALWGAAAARQSKQ